MNGASHLIGGMTAAALTGFHRPSELAVVAAASLLPDMDRHNSLLGRFIPFLPKLLETTVGKRTITHSAVFGSVIALLFWIWWPQFLLPFVIGFGSHILLDIPTGRVFFLWPFSVNVGISFGIPPVFIETAAMILWGVWMALGGYTTFHFLGGGLFS